MEQRKTVTQYYIPQAYGVSNLNSLMNNKTPREIAQLMCELQDWTEDECEDRNGDASTIKLHRLKRGEGPWGKFSENAYVMTFSRPETDDEYVRRIAREKELAEQEARYKVLRQRSAQREIKKMEAALALLKGKK